MFPGYNMVTCHRLTVWILISVRFTWMSARASIHLSEPHVHVLLKDNIYLLTKEEKKEKKFHKVTKLCLFVSQNINNTCTCGPSSLPPVYLALDVECLLFIIRFWSVFWSQVFNFTILICIMWCWSLLNNVQTPY